MKKIFSALVLFTALTGAAFAYGGYGGGFSDGANQVIGVKQALRSHDDAYVTLRGTIVRRLTSDEYLFKDATGTIVVEIDAEKWMGQTVGPNDTIEITGEVDRDFASTKIDVDIVKLISK